MEAMYYKLFLVSRYFVWKYKVYFFIIPVSLKSIFKAYYLSIQNPNIIQRFITFIDYLGIKLLQL